MPLKTRAIAEECKISIYMALNYMRGLERQRKVTPDSRGKGRQLTGIY
ncbi:FaeA/PapI family transcriptional regulator [Escherichia coli]|nr:FaeA/PapI family transcriptional regulator [Escherichia coli]MEC5283315.1 FaeA/PapI family transcriptional regulator [Escherichia coli]